MTQLQKVILGLVLLSIRAVISKQLVPDPSIKIAPSSITVNRPTEITFTGSGVDAGDVVVFTNESCTALAEDPGTAAIQGEVQGGKATLTAVAEGKGLRLCVKPQGTNLIVQVFDVSLDVVAPTPSAAVTSINRRGVIKGATTVLTLEGAVQNAKAAFVPLATNCASVAPGVQIDANAQGSFTFPASAPGVFKLCYRAPGGSDSVEQWSASGSIQLQVMDAIATPSDTISKVFPDLITVNVPTMLTFTGTTPGDRATFVAGASGDCSSVAPAKDVGAGHAMFTLGSSGEYTLCYRVYGASDSVAQQTTLRVKAPGVTQAMVNRWKSKNGVLDCTKLNYVPYCGVSGRVDCPDTYMVQSGIGYRCYWDDVVSWPAKCISGAATDPDTICMSGKCSNDACW